MEKNKYTIQIPTVQFGLISVEMECSSPEMAVEEHNHLIEAYRHPRKPLEGLSDDVMDMMIEMMCLGKTIVGGTELYATATPSQQKELQRLKRTLKRIKNKQGEPEIE